MDKAVVIILGIVFSAELLLLFYFSEFWNWLSFLIGCTPFWICLSIAMLSEE